MNESEARRVEVARNFDVFLARLPDLIADHRGEFALMRHGEILGYYASLGAAIAFAATSFDDQMFSVQEVTDRTIDLGWYSHAATADSLQP